MQATPTPGEATVKEALARDPDAWQGAYNAACFEALAGERAAAFEHLRRAVAGGGDEVRTYCRDRHDLDSLRDDPRYSEAMA